MAADNETLADIVAEMREECHTGDSSCLEWIGAKMHYYADRIEAAWKREKSEIESSALSVGGVVEASHRSIKIPVEVVPTCSVARAQRRLELLRAQMQNMADNVECGEKVCFNPRAVIAEIDDTLATHPRNCDVFADALWDTISRAWQDWLLTPEFNKRKIGGTKEFCYWFLGPAEKGGAK